MAKRYDWEFPDAHAYRQRVLLSTLKAMARRRF